MSSSRSHPGEDPPRNSDPASETTSYLIAPTVGWVLVKLATSAPHSSAVPAVLKIDASNAFAPRRPARRAAHP